MNFNRSEASENVKTSDKTVDTFVSDSCRKKKKKSARDLDLSNTDSLMELASVDVHKALHKKNRDLLVPDDCIKSSNFDDEKASISVDIAKKFHKKKKDWATVNDHGELPVDSESATAISVVDVLKKSYKKKKGVPAMDDRNSGVVKVIEIRKNKKQSVGGVELDSCESPFGSGIGGGWQ